MTRVIERPSSSMSWVPGPRARYWPGLVCWSGIGYKITLNMTEQLQTNYIQLRKLLNTDSQQKALCICSKTGIDGLLAYVDGPRYGPRFGPDLISS